MLDEVVISPMLHKVTGAGHSLQVWGGGVEGPGDVGSWGGGRSVRVQWCVG